MMINSRSSRNRPSEKTSFCRISGNSKRGTNKSHSFIHKRSITNMSVLKPQTSAKLRAGKVNYDENLKIATPDAIQGVIKVSKNEDDDSYSSFVWSPKGKALTSDADELLLFPGDASWKHVQECKTGRVFELKFESSGARHLFWSQEINEDEDNPSELSTKDKEFNDFVQKLISLEEEEQELEEEPKQLEQQTQNSQSQHIFELSDIHSSTNLTSLVDSLDEESLNKLYSHLPPSFEKSRSSLKEVLLSGHYKKAVNSLSNALNQGGSFVVAKSLGYEYEGEGVDAYLRVAKRQQGKEKK